MWNAIKAEFKNILHNRLLLISTTVICIIPFLYSIFFLKSVWDPYGSTENLPVAVVNKDVPVEYRGQTMDIGHRMVKELKKNKQLKWEIVSPEKAHYGLTHRKYYTVVTIPKNFSKDATTVLNKHPQQMQLKYETNGSLNYIGEVISQLGMTKLNEKIRAQVTRAYAQAMFKALHTVGKGMGTAASGAKQLDNGLVTLQSGMNQYVAGVSQVNNGVQKLRVSVAPLAAGAQQLASGSQTLANGIRQYTGGVGQLAAGLGKLNANSGALNSGASQLQSGLGQLRDNSSAIQSGTGDLAKYTGELDKEVNGNDSQLSQLGNMDFEGIMGAMNQAQDLQKSLAQLQTGLTTAKAALAGVQESAGKLQQASGALAGVSQVKGQLTSAANGAGSVAKSDAEIAGKLQALAGSTSDNNIKSQLGALATQAGANAKTAGDSAKTIADVGTTLNSLNSLGSSLSDMQSQLGQLSQMSTILDNADGTIKQANTLLNTLNGYKGTLSSLSGSKDKIKALQSATSQIAGGANTLNTYVTQYTNGVDSAAVGAGTLTSGIGQYTAGVAQAGAGVGQLTANSGQLNSGAGQLAGALGQLNGQVPALTAGVNQLAAGTQQLVDNSPALVQGITKLNVGAGKLADALGKGAKTINGIKTSNRTAKMIAEPSVEKHSNYSYVPNYGHALAPYVLSVALYVGMLVFNFVYPIRRVADPNASATAWWFSKVVVGGIAAIAMAVVECGIMMMCGLTIDHVPSFFTTTILFGLASMAVVMFLSMTFDNPGRFVAMVLLMLQLGGSGGTFPMEVTMKFYNVIHWYLPMTYSILGLRDSISGGLGTHYTMFCNLVLLGIAVVFNLLLLLTMKGIASHEFHAPSVASEKENEHGPMGEGDGFNSK
ncbi:MAG: YhgE/Pip domain-containing protein [Limosilactobacillus sp.]|jgi:putative membrane protein|uniref:YhgE/Pip domain-containing protein n=1 Tax=Limosilactobacillus sp. TaxID=2773925 RepID=UPI0025BC7A8E|nr:YhgE/Pip domain-containing protein [Limosilactobacillus sp.]MCI1974409.1 YhgE/Pip domain-containing protein [Limosilactobacillus sp.]MCI2030596.1 YhgE/Pip domain-containing protein [Limosilactobacillus sp.]